MRNSTRYPYTYAADYIRMKVGDDYGKGLISRAAAAQAQTIIAKALNIDKETISKALAELYILENDTE
jgi:hypothetical protein